MKESDFTQICKDIIWELTTEENNYRACHASLLESKFNLETKLIHGGKKRFEKQINDGIFAVEIDYYHFCTFDIDFYYIERGKTVFSDNRTLA